MATDFLSISDFTDVEMANALDIADASRRRVDSGAPLAGKVIAMLFEKPSLRTKVSFDIAVFELGGHAVYLGADEVGLDTREPVEDVARVLDRWAAVLVARVNRHSTLERLAACSSVPVVNALSDVEHPCQAMADLLTIRQYLPRLDRPRMEDVKVAYVGDANNCALSLGLACAAVGCGFSIASPPDYAFSKAALDLIAARGVARGMSPIAVTDPAEAVAGADVIYTDVWTSMGQEAESDARRVAFQGYQVNEALLATAGPGALVMHPMPVHYGEEMPAGMLDHPRSVAFDQAENRLHAQKAVLRILAAGE